jgi:hypothetical protein
MTRTGTNRTVGGRPSNGPLPWAGETLAFNRVPCSDRGDSGEMPVKEMSSVDASPPPCWVPRFVPLPAWVREPVTGEAELWPDAGVDVVGPTLVRAAAPPATLEPPDPAPVPATPFASVATAAPTGVLDKVEGTGTSPTTPETTDDEPSPLTSDATPEAAIGPVVDSSPSGKVPASAGRANAPDRAKVTAAMPATTPR